METVKIGIIGIGNMGSSHANCIYKNEVEGLTLKAVADIDANRLKWAEEQFPEVARFSTAEEMIEKADIDAVIIAVPHYFHPVYAIKAFKKGLHVMCEKPAGVYTKAVREMNEEAEKCGLVFGMMFNQRTNSLYKKMRELVQSGELGEIKRTNWIITDWYRCQSYYDSGSWRATWDGEGGGVLLNQCPHNLDLWQWICGMPKKVTAFCHNGKWHNIEVEDDVTAYVEYENGATGVFVTTTADAPGTNRFEITLDRGKLVCENGKLSLYRLDVSEREHRYSCPYGFSAPAGKWEEIETDGENPQHKGVLKAFAGAILRGEPLVAEGKEGINGLTISNAMHLSSWTNSTVTLPIDEDLFLSKLTELRKTSKHKSVEAVHFDTEGTYGS